MFDAAKFLISVDGANIRHYQDKMQHLPKYTNQTHEFTGFSELAKSLQQK